MVKLRQIHAMQYIRLFLFFHCGLLAPLCLQDVLCQHLAAMGFHAKRQILKVQLKGPSHIKEHFFGTKVDHH